MVLNGMIERQNKVIPVERQTQLLGIARSTVYYQPRIDPYNLELMHLIDEEYTKTPFYSSQFTSLAFLECLEERNIQISMDGKGRAIGQCLY